MDVRKSNRCQAMEKEALSPPVIGISDALMKRLNREEEVPTEERNDELYLKGLDDFWTRRLACMEITHTNRNKLTEKEFYKDYCHNGFEERKAPKVQKILGVQEGTTGPFVVASIEKNFEWLPDSGPFCRSGSRNVISCYRNFTNEILACRSITYDYVDCMVQARDETIQNSAALRKKSNVDHKLIFGEDGN
uniref:Uncharacterized protein n=1 Tax=Timema bartmani TaxID=61472 RepID=A0A7R9I835_9NEOP|nr:unnamed protein product [Timema bartmani]